MIKINALAEQTTLGFSFEPTILRVEFKRMGTRLQLTNTPGRYRQQYDDHA
jgi:hypothetical protein